MAAIISHNIISPLGYSSQENYTAVKKGTSALRRYENAFGTPLCIMASLFSDEQRANLEIEGLSLFESVVVNSVVRAMENTNIDISSKDSCLIISTTKGNVNELGLQDDESILPGITAEKIAKRLGFTTTPIVVCNACISGVSALVLASRLIDSGTYKNVVVCGCDLLGRFTISGFESLRALSPEECRPFDEERIGLNLGEAAATIILSNESGNWYINDGAIRNDAYHISTPSNKGIGAAMAAKAAVNGHKDELAFINLHGTATMYNDQMEWMALKNAGLTDIQANALKGYFGHTMGAAGVLECIISLMAVDDNTILGTRGFNISGVTGDIKITSSNLQTEKESFLKLISGFGGCNGAIRLSRKACDRGTDKRLVSTQEKCNVRITDREVLVNGATVPTQHSGTDLLLELYKKYVNDYPKFYKMDILSRLGFIAAEILCKNVNIEDIDSNTAIILFNHSSSINADKDFHKTIKDENDFFPSPSIFVYTLPNIVNGEIALKHSIHSETGFYILPERNDKIINEIIEATFLDSEIKNCICGWVECINPQHFEAEIELIEKLNH